MYALYNFLIFGIIGWIIENLYSYYSYGHFQKDGFLNIPLKPMYGFAMSILIFFYDIVPHNLLFIILCFIIPTSVEYMTGLIMRNNFSKDYWDYTDQKFNLNGIVCIKFSIYWTLLTFIGVLYFKPFISDRFYFLIYPYWEYLAPIAAILILTDAVNSTKYYKLHIN